MSDEQQLSEREIEERVQEAKERATCSQCLARTYRHEECVCEDDDGDAELYEHALHDLGVPAGRG